MKRNVLGLAALVLAIAVSSFTVNKNSIIYAVYQDAGAQNDMGNYDIETASPGVMNGTAVLGWFSVESVDASLDVNEFDAAFESSDETSTSSNSLNDESEKTRTFTYSSVSGLQAQLEKKAI